MTATPRNYADGLQDGQIELLRQTVGGHDVRLNSHSQRLVILERIMWSLGGILVFLELFPKISQFFAP